MKNYVQDGGILTASAPRAVSSGDGALIGSVFGIACGTYANGAEGEFKLEGVFDQPALNTDTASVGALAYWDNTNFRVTTSASGNTKIGFFWLAKTNGQTTARVRLNEAY